LWRNGAASGGARKFFTGELSPFPSLLPFLFPPSSPTLEVGPFPPLSSLPLEVGPLKSSYGVWGSAVSSPSGVWGRAPKEIDFGAF